MYLITSRLKNKFDEFSSGTSPASTAAFLIKNLCSSLHKAGTVMTHRIFVATIFPTYSYNLFNAFSPTYLKVSLITVINGSCLPS